MRTTWISSTVLALVLTATVAVAQTTAPATTALAPNAGAFDQLSPGNQKIARALFDAQQSSTTTAGTPSTTTKPLSLAEIAALKQSGKGWGEVFKSMKTQGLVQDKNLGQVVSKFNHSTSSGTQITTASGRTVVVGGSGRLDGVGSSPKGVADDDGQRGGSTAAADSSGSRGSGRGSDSATSSRHGGGYAAHGGGRGK